MLGIDMNWMDCSAAVNNQTNEGVAIKKVTNVFSKKILAKRALREIKLLQHFRGHRNVSGRRRLGTDPTPPIQFRSNSAARATQLAQMRPTID